MKVRSVLLLLSTALACTFPGSCLPEEEDAEELPQAEPYRQPRPSFNRGGFGGGGGGGGGFSEASYDLSKTYDSMLTKNANNRMGSDYNNYNSKFGANKMDLGFSDAETGSRNDYYDPYAAPSEYGGYASESGYGYSMTKYVDCNSAIALLSLLLFLDVLRDVVESLTMTTRRRKRSDKVPSIISSPIEQFMTDGGADALVEGLPEIVLPLLGELNDAVHEEDYINDHCLSGSLCKANWALSDRYGGVGRIFGALLSNLVAKAYVGSQPDHLYHALEASKWGRLGTVCHEAYPCAVAPKNSTSQR